MTLGRVVESGLTRLCQEEGLFSDFELQHHAMIKSGSRLG